MLTLPRKLRRGERIVLANTADLKRTMPRLVARTAAIGGADVAGTEGCDWKLEARVLGGARRRPSHEGARAADVPAGPGAVAALHRRGPGQEGEEGEEDPVGHAARRARGEHHAEAPVEGR